MSDLRPAQERLLQMIDFTVQHLRVSGGFPGPLGCLVSAKLEIEDLARDLAALEAEKAAVVRELRDAGFEPTQCGTGIVKPEVTPAKTDAELFKITLPMAPTLAKWLREAE